MIIRLVNKRYTPWIRVQSLTRNEEQKHRGFFLRSVPNGLSCGVEERMSARVRDSRSIISVLR